MKRSIRMTLCLLFVFAVAGAAFVTAAAAATKQLAKPTLLSPAPEKVFQNVPRTVTVAWSMDPNAVSYTVNLYYSNSGPPDISGTPVATESTANTAYTFVPSSTVLAHDGYYAWTVQAIGNGTTYTDSRIASSLFIFNTVITLGTPEPISPVTGVTFVNDPRITTLAWDTIPGATGYTVDVEYKDSEGDWVADSLDFPATSTTAAGTVVVTGSQNSSYTSTGLSFTAATSEGAYGQPESYRWRVKADGDGGVTTNNSKYGKWYYFFYENPGSTLAD